ncbi:MAG: NAD(P)/FAD-dependent oxidoreductase [Caldimonas sp.]
MNLAIEGLPERCDVLVVGAGPAGSAAARVLARGGRSVVLVDTHAFPRDKVCGDGLAPDAHRALDRLGLREAVLAEARPSPGLGVVAPLGGRIDVPGNLAVLARKRFDAILCDAAVAAGARMFAPLRFVAPLRAAGAGGAVVGACLQQGDRVRQIHAQWVVLASGAQPQALIATGMCERRGPSGIALRGYVKNPAMASRITSMEVVWHKRFAPGYGWIFPCGDDVFNIGVGVICGEWGGGRAKPALNLRDAFAAFRDLYPPAAALLAGGTWQAEPGHELTGAPLRCSLAGARFEAPGVLVTGEAAGATYAVTGEGIGKAMETAIHAAEAILVRAAGDVGAEADAAVRADYAARLLALQPRFAAYDQAQRATARPWLIDLLVWSARRSPHRLERIAGLLEETYLPTDAATVRGVLRRLFDWR